MSKRAVARRLNISRRQLAEWLRRYPEFAAAVEEGRRLADVRVVQSLYQRAIGREIETTEVVVEGDKRRVKKTRRQIPGEAASIRFWLKNRRGEQWRDKPSAPPPEEIIAQMRPIPDDETKDID